MSAGAHSFDGLITALVPSLSRSLAEQFNVFRVMHHGTHEKQLSNVFAWLLDDNGSHGLGDTFQQIFVGHVNRHLSPDSHLPTSGYRVTQEVNTTGYEDARGENADIADIVLAGERASIVIENYESSDGHGHDYQRYLAHGSAGGRQSVVVLLCVRHLRHLQTGGWEAAAVVTYSELLVALEAHIARDGAWRAAHPRQDFFLNELVEQFTEGPGVVSVQDRIRFIEAMCDTGESARYGRRPHDAAAQEFADVVAQHARRQFEEGRQTLAEVKRSLRRYAEQTLLPRMNKALPAGPVTAVETRFVGQWEWAVALRRDDPYPDFYLEFGPTAVVENQLVPEPVVDPDFTRIFVTRQATDGDGIDRIHQTDVRLDEILSGLGNEDSRLLEAVLAICPP